MAKKKDSEVEAGHLEWLVKCRSQNQHTSLVLYKLMTENIARLRKDEDLADVGIALVAISFNLWRAVFLVHSPREGRGHKRKSTSVANAGPVPRGVIPRDTPHARADRRSTRARFPRSPRNPIPGDRHDRTCRARPTHSAPP